MSSGSLMSWFLIQSVIEDVLNPHAFKHCKRCCYRTLHRSISLLFPSSALSLFSLSLSLHLLSLNPLLSLLHFSMSKGCYCNDQYTVFNSTKSMSRHVVNTLSPCVTLQSTLTTLGRTRSWVRWLWVSAGRNWTTLKTWRTSTSTASSPEPVRY